MCHQVSCLDDDNFPTLNAFELLIEWCRLKMPDVKVQREQRALVRQPLLVEPSRQLQARLPRARHDTKPGRSNPVAGTEDAIVQVLDVGHTNTDFGISRWGPIKSHADRVSSIHRWDGSGSSARRQTPVRTRLAST